jgi:uncharacterized membrane protein YfcA
MRPFLLGLAAFYVGWLALVVAGDHGRTLASHWGIALAMLAGSYFAGSTPMGGGTVAFPVLVLLQGAPAALGRDFAFAIQATGMTSAAIFILCRRQPLEGELLRFALLGSALGTPFGILFVAPLASPLAIKIVFAVVWGSFGLLHLTKIREIAGYHGIAPGSRRFDRSCGALAGLLGGALVVSITGVGLEMILYVLLVLLCQADLRIAIPTAVIGMAFTSLVGTATKLAFSGFEPGVFEHWLAAAPVVVLGAPFGALVVSKIGRGPTLVVVSILCVLQLVWTLARERAALGPAGLALALLAVGLCVLGFAGLERAGKRIARRYPAAAMRRSTHEGGDGRCDGLSE